MAMTLINNLVDGLRMMVALVQDVTTILASVPKWLGGGKLVTQLKNGKRVLDDYEARANGVTGATKAAKEQAEALAIEAERAAEAAARQAESYESRVRQLQIESVALAGNTELAREMQLAAEGYTKEQIAALTAMERQNQVTKDRIKTEEESSKAAEALEKRFGNRLDQLAAESVALSGNAELAQQMKLAAEGYSQSQIDTIMAMEKQNALLKTRKEAEKEALAAAKKYFEEQRKIDEKRREDASRGPGAGMEEGSAAAAKFMADQVNAAIGAAAVPETPTPGEREIAHKTQELIDKQEASNLAQKEEIAVIKDLLVEFRQNRFTRFR
jgi:DNA integrity scanning protein DisA with diadenylate cyclase activity